jgi:hypothetical protein
VAASHRAGAASLAGHVAGLSCESLTIYVLGTAEGVPRGEAIPACNLLEFQKIFVDRVSGQYGRAWHHAHHEPARL